MKPIIREQSVLNKRRLDFISPDKINQVIQLAKKNVDKLIETSQKLTFEIRMGNEVSEMCSGNAIL
jgi:hypothetical protein